MLAPFEEWRAYCFAAVCRSVRRSVCRSTSSFRTFSSHCLHILKRNFIYRFIIRISRFSVVLGTIEPFLTGFCPLGLCKILIICSFRSFSLHWLHILKGNLVYRFSIRISRSSSVLGTIEPFLYRIMPLRLRKILVICSFCSFFFYTGCTY
jgi:hypothetical protein